VFPHNLFGRSGKDAGKRLAPVGDRIRIAELCITKQTKKKANKSINKRINKYIYMYVNK